MIFSAIKAKLYLGIGLLVAALLGAVKIQSARLASANEKNKNLTAKDEHHKVVEEKKIETTIELRSRTADLAKELEEKKTSSELEDPNSW